MFNIYQILLIIPGGQPSGWQQRYPSSAFPSDRGMSGPPFGPRGPPPPGQWPPQSDRPGSYPAYGPKPMGPSVSWPSGGMPGQPGMRPQYRSDMRGPGPIPRPVSSICKFFIICKISGDRRSLKIMIIIYTEDVNIY